MNKRKNNTDDIILINLSVPFLQRAKCKFCGKGPTYYYCVRKRNYLDVRKPLQFMEWVKRHHYRMCSNDYLFDDPKNCISLIYFSYEIPYKSYNPALHRVKGIPRNNFREYVGCDCGKTTWGFYYKSAIDRPEIINRKSRNSYPQKFVY